MKWINEENIVIVQLKSFQTENPEATVKIKKLVDNLYNLYWFS